MRIGVLPHIVADTIASVRNAGLQNTLRIIASTARDRNFDQTYGTQTSGYEDPRVYASGDPRAERATLYVPTRAGPFLSFLQHTRVPASGTLVDFGCGKGRAMMVAALYGFRSITGVELSPDFCAATQRNLARFHRHVPQADFEVICGDASDYAIRPTDSVFYFYDPFDDELLGQCLRNIAQSLERQPRRVAVIYHNSISTHRTPFDDADFLVAAPVPRFEGNSFQLYRNSAVA